MNILATALLAFAALGTASTVAVAADCTDLAGNGHVCATLRDDGADVDVLIEPQPPVAVAAVNDCVDLAGQGHACATVDGTNVDVDVLVEPTPPAASRVAEPSCTDLAGQGSFCYEATVDPEGGNFDVDTVLVLAPTIPPV